MHDFLIKEGVPVSSDFHVSFEVENAFQDGCTGAEHRRLSVALMERANHLECLPVVEVPGNAASKPSLYVSGGPYLRAQVDRATELAAYEIATGLHRKFSADLSRTELTLAPSGRLEVTAFIPCPLLSSGSLITCAANLAGFSFHDLCWELVTAAAGRRFGVVDVHSDAPYPGNVLSNFFPHRFHFDDVDCSCVEGLLQSLKYQDPVRQTEIAKLVGSSAKHAGATQNNVWQSSGVLWWRADPIGRNSERYQLFLQSIYDCVFSQSAAFRDALMATRGRLITHRIGTRVASGTVLTEREFVRNLAKLRSKALERI